MHIADHATSQGVWMVAWIQKQLETSQKEISQPRLRWICDSILYHMHSEIIKVKSDETTIFTDIPGKSINGGSIPANIVTTAQQPDIVLINRKEKKIAL